MPENKDTLSRQYCRVPSSVLPKYCIFMLLFFVWPRGQENQEKCCQIFHYFRSINCCYGLRRGAHLYSLQYIAILGLCNIFGESIT